MGGDWPQLFTKVGQACIIVFCSRNASNISRERGERTVSFRQMLVYLLLPSNRSSSIISQEFADAAFLHLLDGSSDSSLHSPRPLLPCGPARVIALVLPEFVLFCSSSFPYTSFHSLSFQL
ncbi:uncharacterized protein LOC123500480 [Portunus trituberculatus]|uniref:uncharacterized protein LOC123500480 n=1 Tax=Portunus trituberculatus TaxID=210409 RepID=UPI001E1CFDAE|nr:uncharacterized protein LOC123500480 [Portunus trituberculatus]